MDNKFGIDGFLLSFFKTNKIKIKSILEIGTGKGNTIRAVIDHFQIGLFLVDNLEKFGHLKHSYKTNPKIDIKDLKDFDKKESFDLIHINLDKVPDVDFNELNCKYLVLSNIKEGENATIKKGTKTLLEINHKNKKCLILTT
jgi:hypothetical protein